ncbi:hypothetical protein [Deinococcus sonorensis]|uniref:Uncharacterized protein n=2 Tax=Deinococcus sonorensis TaxID=309891 RepID=A0AAU7UB81_9DEIO
MRPVLLPCFLLALISVPLSACAPRMGSPNLSAAAPVATWPSPLTPRPPGSPDVLLLSISGRCPPPCLNAPDDNTEYLARRGVVQALTRTLQDAGLSVQSSTAAAHLTLHRPHGSTEDVPGFLQVEAQLTTAYQRWMVGRRNPTRIVLLAHSHGVVWTHALARAHPEILVAALIDLDGLCDVWERDNARIIQAYVRQLGHNPWPFNLADSCGSVMAGHLRYDLKDVVTDNVERNLEVESQRFAGRSTEPLIGPYGANYAFDLVRNVRTDGSRRGIQTFVASTQNHSQVTQTDGPALRWVQLQLAALARGWATPPAP